MASAIRRRPEQNKNAARPLRLVRETSSCLTALELGLRVFPAFRLGLNIRFSRVSNLLALAFGRELHQQSPWFSGLQTPPGTKLSPLLGLQPTSSLSGRCDSIVRTPSEAAADVRLPSVPLLWRTLVHLPCRSLLPPLMNSSALNSKSFLQGEASSAGVWAPHLPLPAAGQTPANSLPSATCGSPPPRPGGLVQLGTPMGGEP